MGYCKKHDAYNGNGYCPHCCTKEGDLHASNCPELRIAFERLERERDEAREEVERLREWLKKTEPFIRLVLHSTEARYDDPQSEYYDDGAQYEIMRECEEILAAIGAAMREGE